MIPILNHKYNLWRMHTGLIAVKECKNTNQIHKLLSKKDEGSFIILIVNNRNII